MGIKADEKLLRRFLLGDLPEAERARVEKALFDDDEFHLGLRAIEADLVDEYVRGELSGQERSALERRLFSSIRGRGQLEFAATLRGALPENAQPAVRRGGRAAGWWSRLAQGLVRPSYALAAAALVLLAIGFAWLVVENHRLQKEAMQALAELDSLKEEARRESTQSDQKSRELESRNQELARSLENEKRELDALQQAQSAGGWKESTASFVLIPGLVRNVDEPVRVRIPASARAVRLQLDLEAPEDFTFYRAEIATAGGTLVWSADSLTSRSTSYGQAVTVIVPSMVFFAGEYEVALRGVKAKGQPEDVAYYYLTVMKK